MAGQLRAAWTRHTTNRTWVGCTASVDRVEQGAQAAITVVAAYRAHRQLLCVTDRVDEPLLWQVLGSTSQRRFLLQRHKRRTGQRGPVGSGLDKQNLGQRRHRSGSHVSTRTRTRTCTRTRTQAHTHTHTSTDTRTSTHKRIHTLKHKHTHKRTHTRAGTIQPVGAVGNLR